MPSLNKRKAEEPLEEDESDEEFDIGETLKLILSSKSNANLICDVLRYIQADDLDDEELALAVMGLEKWFRQEIEQGLFNSTKQASRATFQKWSKVSTCKEFFFKLSKILFAGTIGRIPQTHYQTDR